MLAALSAATISFSRGSYLADPCPRSGGEPQNFAEIAQVISQIVFGSTRLTEPMGAASHVQAALAIVDAGKAGVIGEDRSMSVRTRRIIAWLLLAAYAAAYWYWYWRILHGNVAREALICFLVLSVGVLAVVVKLLRVDKPSEP